MSESFGLFCKKSLEVISLNLFFSWYLGMYLVLVVVWVKIEIVNENLIWVEYCWMRGLNV